MTIKVLFVASNPSKNSPDNSAMHFSTKSRKILDNWISGLNIEAYYCNVSDYKTNNNKPLKKSQIIEKATDLLNKILESKCDYIISLGKAASYALDYLSIEHLELPHPSGLNRKLNNKGVVDDIKNRLRNISQGKNNIEK